ncbi:MAG: redoxin domain-containing protein [Bacteroidota bacterium]|nr:redoxin domain-containing protein [Bacteroidota bacterium]
MFKQFTITSLGLLLTASFMSSCSKYDFTSTFSTLPTHPIAGGEVTILYNSEGTVLDSSDQISAIVRTYGDRNYQPASMFSMPNNVSGTVEYKMIKTKGGWTVQLSVPDTVVGLVVTLNNEDETDYNGGLGYWIPLYSSDQTILPGAEAGYAASLVRRGWGAELDKSLYADTLLGFYENEFSRNPDKQSGFAFSYFAALRKSKGTDGLIEIENNLEAMSHPDLWTEEHLFFLSAWYGAVKNQEKADFYKTKSQEKFPTGRWVQRGEIGQIYKEVGPDEKIIFLDEFISKYPNHVDLSYVHGVIIGEYIKEGSYTLALEYLNSLDENNWSERPVFAAVKNLEKIENNEVPELAEIVTKAVHSFRQYYEEPNSPQPPLIIGSVWQDNRAIKLAVALDALGVVTNLIGNNTKALSYLEEAYSLTNNTNKEINEHFSSALLENGSTSKAKEILEESMRGGIQSPKIEETLKEIFVKTHKSETGFASYYSELKGKSLGNLEAEIKAKLVTENAPEFTLLDTEGKEVSLSDYKGKVVILDFWATWCGPCRASFPGMKKAADKYKKDDEVKFLFINTRENVKNKLETVKGFMDDNEYPFHVLMDDLDEVYESFGVALLPTKVFVDKTGNIRYRSLGFKGVPELLDELELLISILKSSNRKMSLSG